MPGPARPRSVCPCHPPLHLTLWYVLRILPPHWFCKCGGLPGLARPWFGGHGEPALWPAISTLLPPFTARFPSGTRAFPVFTNDSGMVLPMAGRAWRPAMDAPGQKGGGGQGWPQATAAGGAAATLTGVDRMACASFSGWRRSRMGAAPKSTTSWAMPWRSSKARTAATPPVSACFKHLGGQSAGMDDPP